MFINDQLHAFVSDSHQVNFVQFCKLQSRTLLDPYLRQFNDNRDEFVFDVCFFHHHF